MVFAFKVILQILTIRVLYFSIFYKSIFRFNHPYCHFDKTLENIFLTMSTTYTSYLQINPLLELQKLQSSPKEHDEMLFIIIHQTYELWFKQILHEFTKLSSELNDGNTWGSVKTLRRVLTIFKTLVGQIDILETMTPLEFNSFRKFLGQSSGFQSLQFREIEILCGLRFPLMKEAHKEVPAHLLVIEKRMEQLTLWESFCNYLSHKGYDAKPIRENEKGLLFNPSDKIQSTLIGTKKGTGGSDGVTYLKKTLDRSIFPDLWAIRSEF